VEKGQPSHTLGTRAMDQEVAGDVTALLRSWRSGNIEARDDLMQLVYAELRRRAAAYLRGERADHTLSPTALVHETYLRLVGQQRVAWQSRAHFLGVAAQLMRRILVDHARRHLAAKRRDEPLRVRFNEPPAAANVPDCDLLLLDQALNELTALDARQSQIIELRFFGGLAEQEIAEVLSVSRSTVTREWQTARAWLFRRMRKGAQRRVRD
jgi:RNA polymerase sigma factor (TIGR02999 family)